MLYFGDLLRKEFMKLKPCPFCGMTSDTEWEDTLHPSGVGWREDMFTGDEIPLRHYLGRDRQDQWQGACYEIHCNVIYSGCGVNISGDSKEDVIEKWNKRVL